MACAPAATLQELREFLALVRLAFGETVTQADLVELADRLFEGKSSKDMVEFPVSVTCMNLFFILKGSHYKSIQKIILSSEQAKLPPPLTSSQSVVAPPEIIPENAHTTLAVQLQCLGVASGRSLSSWPDFVGRQRKLGQQCRLCCGSEGRITGFRTFTV